ncbi:formimidoylglutamate deiminase, partial [Acinetobacter baumannii]
TWRETMYGFLRQLGPDEVEAIAAQLYVEMLKGGYTGVAEFHYLHHDRDGHPYADRAELSLRILAAARGAGIRLTHLPVLYAHAGFGG